MADPTAVNGQITDAVTQANLKVLGESPSQALAMVYQTMAQSVGQEMLNAVASQQQLNLLKQTVTTQGANSVLAMDTGAVARGSTQILTGNATVNALAQLLATVASGQQSVKAADAAPPS
ncbi:MAG: R body protein [Candidatus Entotheonella factor]|uniref:R body protein n=1 Tax=Entotheonella factor TaxID=1429438 RepID=W4LD87_ENTF1|nr:MAG: R body protein [Candidatus Entotheonella factor]